MMRWSWCVVALLAWIQANGRPATAITLGQLDAFETDDAAGWTEGAFSANPPTVISTGGPEGDGDGYLENISAGAGFAGSRQVMFNTDQWAGNYLDEGVLRIAADLRNGGSTDLAMRIGLGQGASPQTATWYVSSTPYVLLAGSGQWEHAVFELTADDLTLAGGSATLEDVLANVDTLRILSATEPSFHGDAIAATLGVDNIAAVGAVSILGDMDGNGLVDFDDIDDFVLGLKDAALYQATYGMPPTAAGDLDGDGDFDFDDVPEFVQLFGPEVLLGDLNGDQEVNGLDVTPFVDVLLAASYATAADMNQDAAVNGLDVSPFVATVLGSGVDGMARPVPEPASWMLAVAGMVALGLAGRRRGSPEPRWAYWP